MPLECLSSKPGVNPFLARLRLFRQGFFQQKVMGTNYRKRPWHKSSPASRRLFQYWQKTNQCRPLIFLSVFLNRSRPCLSSGNPKNVLSHPQTFSSFSPCFQFSPLQLRKLISCLCLLGPFPILF